MQLRPPRLLIKANKHLSTCTFSISGRNSAWTYPHSSTHHPASPSSVPYVQSPFVFSLTPFQQNGQSCCMPLRMDSCHRAGRSWEGSIPLLSFSWICTFPVLAPPVPSTAPSIQVAAYPLFHPSPTLASRQDARPTPTTFRSTLAVKIQQNRT